MPRGKRQYIPKIKGCYECSQRRIHCDRGEPRCTKCVAKGLKCSGLGIRYRFENDQRKASHRQWQATDDARIDLLHIDEATSRLEGDMVPGHQKLCHRGVNPQREHHSFEDWLSDTSASWQNIIPDVTDMNRTPHTIFVLPQSDIASVEIGDWSCLAPFDTLDSGRSSMLLHFGQYIAPELVVVDDQHNGWRRIVLPIARLDSLVMDAVMSAAVAHFATKFQTYRYRPDTSYARAIRSLRERQNLAVQDIFGQQTVLLALLVLLATVMVNGSADFPTIFNLLESALEAAGGEDALTNGELGSFLVKQIRKYRGYAAPLLSQTQGVSRLRLSTRQTAVIGQNMVNGWECFMSYYRSYPEWSRTFATIVELNKQACGIYVARVQAGPSGPPLSDRVAEFRHTLDNLPPGATGEHILVFATFMAAAESVSLDDQEYFTEALLKHYRRNGFANILSAIAYLQKIWSTGATQDWTSSLPQLQVFIV